MKVCSCLNQLKDGNAVPMHPFFASNNDGHYINDGDNQGDGDDDHDDDDDGSGGDFNSKNSKW